MAEPLRDPDMDRAVGQARRTGTFFVRYRNGMRLALLVFVATLFLWGWLRVPHRSRFPRLLRHARRLTRTLYRDWGSALARPRGLASPAGAS